MKYIRLITLMMLVVFMAMFITGCGSDDDNYTMYYIDRDATSLIEKTVKVYSDTASGAIDELISYMDSNDSNNDYQSPLIGELAIDKYEVNDNIITLYFNSYYSDLETNIEVLVRAAIAETFLQVPDISGICFYVNGVPLTDSDGDTIGVMTTDSFAINPGSQINATSTAEITLYFANESGDGLVSEKQTVHFISSTSLEKLVVERLIAGPTSDSMQASVPSEAQVLSVTVNDGICYINFDDGFLVQNYDISENVVIYSIVNSVLELGTANKVQISVNGSSDMVYRDAISLNQMFTRDLSLVSDSEVLNETEVELIEQ